MVRVDRYPQLKAISWQLSETAEITEAEALALYERNWRHVDEVAMGEDERKFLAHLIQTQGNGVFHV